MREVSLRRLQRGWYKEIKELPILVTRTLKRGPKPQKKEPAFILYPFREELVVKTDESDIELSKKEPIEPEGNILSRLFKK